MILWFIQKPLEMEQSLIALTKIISILFFSHISREAKVIRYIQYKTENTRN